MKNKKISIKTIIIIVLIGIIIAGIIISTNNKNTNIEKQGTSKEQLTQTASSNAYVSMSDHLSEISEIQEEANNMQTMELPHYVFSGTKGYIYAYYASSFTSAPTYGSDGVFGTYDLTGVSKLKFKAYSFNVSYYTATIHVSLSDHIPTSLDDMKSSPVYSSFSAGSETEFTLEIPSSLDKSKKYWLLFYSNSASNGYTSAGIKNVYFQ